MRTRGVSRAEYESAWSEIDALVRTEIDRGNERVDEIVRSIETLQPAYYDNPTFHEYFRRIGIPFDADGKPCERLVVRGGEYRRVPFSVPEEVPLVETLIGFLRRHDRIDHVVELGSGVGRNLFSLHTAARRELGRPMRWHSCELTESGRRVASRLGELSPDMQLEVHAFDYYDPDLSFLEPDANVLFFTAFSIEQIPILGREVLDEMLRRTAACHCYHFEPVGWQLDDKLLEARRDRRFLTRLSRAARVRGRRWLERAEKLFRLRLTDGIPGIRLDAQDIGQKSRVSRNSAAWSSRFGYNTNLVDLVRGLEAESAIEIDRLDVNFAGENPFNPLTVVAWSKRDA